jgi:hypothetical protein
MTRVQIHALKLTCGISTDSSHEPERVRDGGHNTGIARLELRVLDMAKAPIERPMEIGNSR